MWQAVPVGVQRLRLQGLHRWRNVPEDEIIFLLEELCRTVWMRNPYIFNPWNMNSFLMDLPRFAGKSLRYVHQYFQNHPERSKIFTVAEHIRTTFHLPIQPAHILLELGLDPPAPTQRKTRILVARTSSYADGVFDQADAVTAGQDKTEDELDEIARAIEKVKNMPMIELDENVERIMETMRQEHLLRSQQLMLVWAMRATSSDGKRVMIRDFLVKNLSRAAIWMARRHGLLGLEDDMQNAMVGIIQALATFDFNSVRPGISDVDLLEFLEDAV